MNFAHTRDPRRGRRRPVVPPVLSRMMLMSWCSIALTSPVVTRSTPLLRATPRAALSVRRAFTRMVDNDQGVEYTVKKKDDEWREELSSGAFQILRNKGTERPGTGEYDKFCERASPAKPPMCTLTRGQPLAHDVCAGPADGHFVCGGCGQPLYSAAAKFDSGCGWPAFDKIVEGAVVTQTDSSFGMKRVEIMCGSCGGHLGHVFEGERLTPTNERHCVNSLSIKYESAPLPADLSEAKILAESSKVSERSSILQALLDKKDDKGGA